MGKRTDKVLPGLNQLRQFDVVRLLEAARNMLNGGGGGQDPASPVSSALAVVNSALLARQQPLTERPRDLAEQMRQAARSLIPIADRNIQHAVLAIMIAADMSEVTEGLE